MKIKKMFSVTLAVVLLLSLFAGCTPADVPSTGDSSVDASVTDSNVSDTSSSETDTSSSETDTIISETNTDASTDTSTDSSTTDTSTDTEPANPYAALLEAKSELTAEDIRRLFETIRLGETDKIDLKYLYGKEGKLAGSGMLGWRWEFDNVKISCYSFNTPGFSQIFVELKKPIPRDRVFDFLRLLGVDPDVMTLYRRGTSDATAVHAMSDTAKHLISCHKVDSAGNIENLYQVILEQHLPSGISASELGTLLNSIVLNETMVGALQLPVRLDPKSQVIRTGKIVRWRFHNGDLDFQLAASNSDVITSVSFIANNSWGETFTRDELDELLQKLGLRRIDFKVEKDNLGFMTYRRVSADKKTEIVIRFSDDKADIFYSIQINCK